MQTSIHTHFSPWTEPRPCWWCHHYGRMLNEGTAALCARPGTAQVHASPRSGCVYWEREPGCDDELEWVPVALAASIQGTSAPTPLATGARADTSSRMSHQSGFERQPTLLASAQEAAMCPHEAF